MAVVAHSGVGLRPDIGPVDHGRPATATGGSLGPLCQAGLHQALEMGPRGVLVQTQGFGQVADRCLLRHFQVIEHPAAGLCEVDGRRAAGGGWTIFHSPKCSNL